MSQIVGIDLGTTNSLVAVFHHGRPQLIPNAHGKLLTPSIVGVLESGHVLVGETACELRITEPTRCAWAFKRWMGQTWQIKLGISVFTAPELSALVLKSLKQDAEVFLKQPVTEAVVTVPAYFNDHQRKATRMAGELAGLVVRRIINEPTAAALAYGFQDRQAEKRLLVFDLGGGTFDVTVMEVTAGAMEIKATAGENFLGGEDFTDRIVAEILSRSGMTLEVEEHLRPRRVSRLRAECETAKRALQHAESATIRLVDSEGNLAEPPAVASLTRDDFQRVVDPLLRRLRVPIEQALRDARLSPSQVDDVLLVGGASRMPSTVDLVAAMFGREPNGELNPDEVVALGAAVQSALMHDLAEVEDLVMTDICSRSLGVEVVKSIGDWFEPGFFDPIIHRNTTIPVSREKSYFTEPAAERVLIKIFQGEARRSSDNLLLGELWVTGIPPTPTGTEISIRFTYDLSGLLEVESFVPGSPKKFQVVLNQEAAGLSAAELVRALERLQKLKIYPRDRLENRRLLQFCERLVGEIAPHWRESFEGRLDLLEAAMSSGDFTRFTEAKRALLHFLSSLGIDTTEFDEGEHVE
jgi:molecular chaperone HscC